MENKFRFHLPLEFSKSKNKEGEEVMKIKGVASTMDKDTDGEVLDPNGFDTSYLMDYGFLNWHHQTKTDPNAIIGEPTKAEVKDNKFYIEGDLYPWSPLAKSIYELAKNLKKSGSKRKLGFSIEGKATERDMLNDKFVKKAKITGVAITPMPKNPASFLDVMKGETDGLYELEYDTEEEEKVSANGGETYIINITKPNGDRITVDKDFNLTYKALTTVTGRALTRESLEGAPKYLKKALIIVHQAHKLNMVTDEQLETVKKNIRI